MGNRIDDEPETLVRDLVRDKNYHRMLIREIEDKLKELSKKYEITIPLDE